MTSIIDHILVNNSADGHIPSVEADKFMPRGGDTALFADWRATFSDHFPLSFTLKIKTSDDDVD